MSRRGGVEDPARLGALVAAVIGVSSDLSLPAVLDRILESALTLVDARYAALGVLDSQGVGFSHFVHVGLDLDEVAAIGHLQEGHGLLGLIMGEPMPVRSGALRDDPEGGSGPENHPLMGSFLDVPIRVRGQVFGNLYMTDKQSADQFSDDDEVWAVALAGAAGIAIDNARLPDRVAELSLMEDRERIAADLHDTIVQRLFAAGLDLQVALQTITDPVASDRIHRAVDDLDETIRQIRTTVFALQAPQLAEQGLRSEILDAAAEAALTSGSIPMSDSKGW